MADQTSAGVWRWLRTVGSNLTLSATLGHDFPYFVEI
jgi:hypothetical protein